MRAAKGPSMLNIALFWILLQPGPAPMWEAREPNQRFRGVYATSTLVDVIAAAANGHIKLAGLDPAEGCRMDAQQAPGADDYDLTGDGFIPLRENQRDTMLPTLLFAKAHNLRVQVLIRVTDDASRSCTVVMVRTCSDPQSCQTPPPGRF